MFKKCILILALVFSFSSFCFGDEVERIVSNGTIYGFRTEGTFTVNIFSILNLSKNTNRKSDKQIENTITYGEAFLFSTENGSEFILLFYLRNGGKIEIKFYQDKAITEQSVLNSYMDGDNSSYVEYEYVRKLTIGGSGVFREFDRNSRLIKEKNYDYAQGMITIYLNTNDQTQKENMKYRFNGEGVYKLRLDSNTESEAIEISTKINSPY